ncbi:MAG: 50S ribosomal protein L18 [Spirochaetota bacterium]
MKKLLDKERRRIKRKKHIRKIIRGTAERPRMTVYKSNRRLYIQVIDDTAGRTLASASNLEKEYRDLKLCVENAGKLGQIIGERLKKINVARIVFDRNGYLYHGIVKAVAESARKAGIQF